MIMKIVSKDTIKNKGQNWRVLSNDDENYYLSISPYTKSGTVSGSVPMAFVPYLIFFALILLFTFAPEGPNIDPVAGVSMALVFIAFTLAYTTGIAEYLAYRKYGGLPALELIDISSTYRLYPDDFSDKINDLINNEGSHVDVATFATVAEEDGLMSDRANAILDIVSSGKHVYDLGNDFFKE